MTLPPIIVAKLRGDLAEVTRLTEHQLDVELRGRNSRVWVTLADEYTHQAGFRVAVLRRDAFGRLHRVGTLKIMLETPPKQSVVAECEVTTIDLLHCYSTLTASRPSFFGFELLPSSWFEAMFRSRMTLRYLRSQLIEVLRQVVTRRAR